MPTSTASSSVVVEAKGLPRELSKGLLKSAISTLLEGREGVVSFLFTDDRQIRSLNRRHRAIDEATDVLSFPLHDLEPGGPWPDSPHGLPLELGDVAVSVDMAKRQAKGHSVQAELLMLCLHGTLHLIGYDDDTAKGRRTMNRLATDALAKVGIDVDSEWYSRHYD